MHRDVLRKDLQSFLEEELEIQVNVSGARELGTNRCLIDMKKKKLKSLKINMLKKFMQGKIYINDDMSKEELEMQGKIRNIAEEEKINGNNVKFGYQKLTMNGQELKRNKKKVN